MSTEPEFRAKWETRRVWTLAMEWRMNTGKKMTRRNMSNGGKH